MNRWLGLGAAAVVAAVVARKMRKSRSTGGDQPCTADLGLRTIERLSPHSSGVDNLPLLVVLHSRGATPEGASALHNALREPARVLTPAAPGRLGDGYAWFEEHLGTKDQDELAREIQRVGPVLAGFIREAMRCRPTQGRPVVTGSSQGGTMALYLASWYPGLISGAVAVNGWLPEQLWKTPMAPTVILSGTRDTTVDPDRTQAYALEMKRRGAPVEFATYDSGHSISADLGRAWKASVNEVMFA
jgi:predicted esterase